MKCFFPPIKDVPRTWLTYIQISNGVTFKDPGLYNIKTYLSCRESGNRRSYSHCSQVRWVFPWELQSWLSQFHPLFPRQTSTHANDSPRTAHETNDLYQTCQEFARRTQSVARPAMSQVRELFPNWFSIGRSDWLSRWCVSSRTMPFRRFSKPSLDREVDATMLMMLTMLQDLYGRVYGVLVKKPCLVFPRCLIAVWWWMMLLFLLHLLSYQVVESSCKVSTVSWSIVDLEE